MKTIYLIFFTLLFVNNIQAQVQGNVNYKDKGNVNYGNNNYTLNNTPQAANANIRSDYMTIIESKVLMNVKADSYTAIFHLTQLGKTAAETDKLMNTRINGLISAIQNLGIAKDNIITDMLSLVPTYEYEVEKKVFSKEYNEVPKGFELKKNIHISYTNSDLLDKIVSAAAKHEIYDLVKVDYFIKDMEKIYDEMRTKALANYAKKKQMYKDLGIDLDTYYHTAVDASSVSFPIESYSSYQAFCSASLDKGKSKVTQAAKPTTSYYNPISSKGFDVVINSAILEPAVQFTYDLKVKFLIERPKKEVKQPEVIKRFYIITEDGNAKQLPID